MLRHRFLFGLAMTVALVAVLVIDAGLDRLDVVNAPGNAPPGAPLTVPPGAVLLALFCTLVVLGGRELARLFETRGMACDRGMVMLAGVSGCVMMWLLPSMPGGVAGAVIATLAVVLLFATMLRHNWLRRQSEGAMANAAVTMFALIYIGVLPGFFLTLRNDHSVWLLASIIAITKACDIGAYFTGRAVGSHKLIRWLSPGKTWEGLVGGVIASALAAVALAAIGAAAGFTGHWSEQGTGQFVSQQYPLVPAAIGGAVIGLIGQFGDLTASLLKRDAEVKDSGRSIPGFGGVLDVLDSPIVVAPLAYWMITLAGRSLAG